MKQRTLAREVSITGNALHTGEAVTLTIKPAPADHGIVFKRIDLHGAPELRPRVDQITDLVRATTIQNGHAKIHTVEHVLSALHGCGVLVAAAAFFLGPFFRSCSFSKSTLVSSALIACPGRVAMMCAFSGRPSRSTSPIISRIL